MKKHLSAEQWFMEVRKAFDAAKDPVRAAAMEAYMKNNFRFIGIPKPIRARITRELFNRFEKPTLEILDTLVPLFWETPVREYHYFAMECLFHQRKHFRESDIHVFEKMMRVHSWWDSIDFISPNLSGFLCKKYPHLLVPTCKRWNADPDFWLQRASLLVQLKYKQDTDAELLFSLIRPLLAEKEFFLRKAIGWSLREYAKYAPEKVVSFVENNPLSPLSRKEALKHLG